MLDAGVGLRDVQISARHADPRTTMRYDRARNNLDRHPNYILAAYVYFYLWDADFGPAFVKICAYFPYPGKVWSTSMNSRPRRVT